MIDCCKSTRRNKKCLRISDKKVFQLPRRFTKKRCMKGISGFTMRSSCAPYKMCMKSSSQKGGKRETQKRNKTQKPMKMLPTLRNISFKNKKHIYKLNESDRKRKMAMNEGVKMEAKKTHKNMKEAALAKKARFNILRIYRRNKKIKECEILTKDMRYLDEKYGLGQTKNICGKQTKKGGKRETPKKEFLYNPDNPKLSFDVYIDKNPSDTIPIKYTTLEDVENTIQKLEKLYKSGKYPHKRIWQVGMIMYVRLKVLKDKKREQFNLAKKYFKFLGERTKVEGEDNRKKLTFLI